VPRLPTHAVGGFALAASIACAYLATPAAPDALVAEAPERDLGELGQGVTAEVEFRLVNRCRGPIKVVDVVKGCDCLSPEISKGLLTPGETATLKTRWETRARRGRTATEILVVYIRGDGSREAVPLKIKADVVPDYDVEAPDLVYGEGRPAERVVRFVPRRLPALALTGSSCTHPAFRAVLGADNATVAVRFDPARWSEDVTDRPGDHPDAELLVRTSSASAPLCRVPLFVERPGHPRLAAEGPPRR